MKKISTRVQAWYDAMLEKQRKNNDAQRLLRLRNEAETLIQVCERNGKIYVCYDGVPLFEEDDVVQSLPEALSTMREHYVAYFKTFKH